MSTELDKLPPLLPAAALLVRPSELDHNQLGETLAQTTVDFIVGSGCRPNWRRIQSALIVAERRLRRRWPEMING